IQPMKQLILCIALCLLFISSKAQNKQPVFSKAGFYSIKNSGREIYNFNVGWRFIKANIKNAEKINFNDKSWEIVNLPHGLEFLPSQASGSINYQGPAWYRKHFNLPDSLKGKKLTLHFEAIMGKSKIYINGQLIKENFGGFLPFQVEIENHIKWGEENVIAILADNSDDPTYPPGKAQNIMDFAYFGGIYRDVYLLSTNKIFISNPNNVDKTAGGGVFVHYEKVSKYNAEIIIKTDIINKNRYSKNINLETKLVDKKGRIITTTITKNRVRSNSSRTITQKIKIKNPHLWSPDKPYLYDLKLMIKDNHGKSIDGLKNELVSEKLNLKVKKVFISMVKHTMINLLEPIDIKTMVT
ncbi:MAG: glycoside hydrolase family 2 protein, partial [Prolixibacteraceae bacterium]